MSLMLALLLSVPISCAFSEIVGITLLRLPLDFWLSYDGLLWFFLVLILSMLVSIFPPYALPGSVCKKHYLMNREDASNN